ncbi:peroxidase [Enemella dayhoffiae]|uniref:Peroxidase n=1 Tax=Enemella dayhoffiae TaxID=2016507 RepID=A0A255GS59_9ACTN|nr:carboxymuconolactone decarboxylase family protein [Enemella dayhoffiae]OYO18638.1 peroxidase [Enemella dayhoffiae]
MGFLSSIESREAQPNYERVFASRPEVYAAWRQLAGAIVGGMDNRLYEVATIGAARALQSTYCSLAHGGVLLDKHVDEDGLDALLAAADSRDPVGAADRDAAVAAFAAKVARGATEVDESDVDSLRAHGLDDQQVFDVTLAAAARCFFSTVLDATGTRADASFRDRLPPELIDRLTSGRACED